MILHTNNLTAEIKHVLYKIFEEPRSSYQYSSPPLTRPPLMRPLQLYGHFLSDGCILFFEDLLFYDHSRSRHTTTKMCSYTTTEPFFMFNRPILHIQCRSFNPKTLNSKKTLTRKQPLVPPEPFYFLTTCTKNMHYAKC